MAPMASDAKNVKKDDKKKEDKKKGDKKEDEKKEEKNDVPEYEQQNQ